MTFEEYKKREEKKIETAKKFMEAGVEFEDIRTVYIADDVKIGKRENLLKAKTGEEIVEIIKMEEN